MLGENIDTTKADKKLIQDLVQISEQVLPDSESLVVSMCGESGSGKTVITLALAEALGAKGLSAVALHMDNYFKLTPRENSRKRGLSLDHVGPDEVNLELMDKHIDLFKSGDAQFERPIIDFKKNYRMMSQEVVREKYKFILVEGTYVSLLKNSDIRVFIERTYQDTHVHRTARVREPQTELIENVLSLEHQIVKSLSDNADFVITKDFMLKNNS